MALDSLRSLGARSLATVVVAGSHRFLSMPETFLSECFANKSSKTIVGFSRIISVDNFCRKSALVSFNLAWNLATLSLAFSYRFDPKVLLDNDLLNFR